MKVLIGKDQIAPELTWDLLGKFMPGYEIVGCLRDEVAEHLDGVDVLVTSKADASVFQQSKITLLHHFGVGLDAIDVDAATKAGVWVARLPAAGTGNGESVAELAILLMLNLAKKFEETQAALQAGKWAQPMGLALLGKTACIVGLGDIGAAIAQRLKPFGMKLTGVRAHPAQHKLQDALVEELYAAANLKEAVANADFVILSINYNASLRNLIDAGVMAAMKPGALLINIARGGLVDEAALLDALKSGHLGGAGLDVFQHEPVDPNHPLLQLPNVVATPHVAGTTDAHFWGGGKALGANLVKYARGEAFPYIVNRPDNPRRGLSF